MKDSKEASDIEGTWTVHQRRDQHDTPRCIVVYIHTE